MKANDIIIECPTCDDCGGCGECSECAKGGCGYCEFSGTCLSCDGTGHGLGPCGCDREPGELHDDKAKIHPPVLPREITALSDSLVFQVGWRKVGSFDEAVALFWKKEGKWPLYAICSGVIAGKMEEIYCTWDKDANEWGEWLFTLNDEPVAKEVTCNIHQIAWRGDPNDCPVCTLEAENARLTAKLKEVKQQLWVSFLTIQEDK